MLIPMEPIDIVYRGEDFFVFDKPPGTFVHPPETSEFRIDRRKIALYALREQLRRPVFPVHRLDAPTSGLVLCAYSSDGASALSRLFVERRISKIYHAVVRGFVEPHGKIDLALSARGGLIPAETAYQCLKQIEIPRAVGKKYPTARYSLVSVQPITGRWHQIRRHFDQISHPLLGDIEHGDSHHNRFFRDSLGIRGLCLRATRLEFVHPVHQQAVRIEAPVSETWRRIYDLFGFTVPPPRPE